MDMDDVAGYYDMHAVAVDGYFHGWLDYDVAVSLQRGTCWRWQLGF